MFFNRKQKRVIDAQVSDSSTAFPSISTRSHSLIFAPEEEPLFDESDFLCFKNTQLNSKSEQQSSQQSKLKKEIKKNLTRSVSFLESVEVIGYNVPDESEVDEVEADEEEADEAEDESNLTETEDNDEDLFKKMSSKRSSTGAGLNIMNRFNDNALNHSLQETLFMGEFTNKNTYSDYFDNSPLTPDKELSFITNSLPKNVFLVNNPQLKPTEEPEDLIERSTTPSTHPPQNLVDNSNFRMNSVDQNTLKDESHSKSRNGIDSMYSQASSLVEIVATDRNQEMLCLVQNTPSIRTKEPTHSYSKRSDSNVESCESVGCQSDPYVVEIEKAKLKKKIRHVQIQVRQSTADQSIQTENNIIENQDEILSIKEQVVKLNHTHQSALLNMQDEMDGNKAIILLLTEELNAQKEKVIQLGHEKDAEEANGVMLTGLVNELSVSLALDKESYVQIREEINAKEELMNKAYIQMRRLLMEKEATNLHIEYLYAVESRR